MLTKTIERTRKEFIMKKFKVIMACVLALALLSGFGIPAFAADGSEGDPYVGGNDFGDTDQMSIVIHKYDVSSFERAKAEELITGGTLAQGGTVSYTPDDSPTGVKLDPADIIGTYTTSDQGSTPVDVSLAEMTSLGDVIFRIEQVKPEAGKAPGSRNVNDYEAVAGGIDEYAKTDATGTISWEGLPKGHYRITEPANDTGNPVGPNSYIISVPMIDPDDSSALLDVVHLYPKNTTSPAPVIIKDKPGPDDYNGNIVTWTIKAQIPETIKPVKGVQEYIINDTLGTGLTYKDNLKVYYLSPGADPVNDPAVEVELDPANDYTAQATVGGSSLKITLEEDGFAKLSAALAADEIEKDSNNRYLLYIVYDSMVSITETDFENGVDPTNEVSLDFTNDDGHSYKDGPPPTTLDTYAGLRVYKKDGSNDTILLPNTKFKIYTALNNDNQTVDTGSVLRDTSGTELEFTTDSAGEFFYGGLGAGKYYLTETQAPTNYKSLDGLTTIEITANDVDTQEIIEATVFNYRDNTFSFPQTGGTGTLIFTLLGIGLLGTAGIIFATTKKHTHHKSDKK